MQRSKTVALALSACCLGLAVVVSCVHPGPGPGPGPVPPPTLPPGPTYSNLLLRQPAPPALTRGGVPAVLHGAIQCCRAAVNITIFRDGRTVRIFRRMPRRIHVRGGAAADMNSRWPLASPDWMDYANLHASADTFGFRMGPFYGNADYEVEFADIGGPYLGGPGSDWNPAFWKFYNDTLDYAGTHGWIVRVVVIDTWDCKHASSIQGFNDWAMPWPQADIDACGITMTPTQERYIRKLVSEAKDRANVYWVTDNEGSQLRGTKRQWYLDVHSIIRDEESKFGITRMVGVDSAFMGPPFDFSYTHSTGPLSPVMGSYTENDERNPANPPEQENKNRCDAAAWGGTWFFWPDDMSDYAYGRTLQLWKTDCGSTPSVGCFAPPSEPDTAWSYLNLGGPGGIRSDQVRASQSRLGSLCREPKAQANGDAAIDALSADLRTVTGICAGRQSDAAMVQDADDPTIWLEYHASAPYDTGCWSTSPQHYPKARWRYLGPAPAPTPPPADACPGDQPAVTAIYCKSHPPAGTYDCTPWSGGAPVAPETDPLRACKEAKAMGVTLGSGPHYSLSSSDPIALSTLPNPMQFKITGDGTGIVTCTAPRAVGNLCRTSTEPTGVPVEHHTATPATAAR